MTQPAMGTEPDARVAAGPNPNRVREHRSWLEISATWIAIISALCGGGFALFRFVGDMESARAREALAYVDRFSAAPVATSYEHFANHFRQFLASQQPHGGPTQAAMVATVADPAIEADTLVVIHFFDNVGACTCKQLCDAQLVTLFLGWEANDFFDYTSPYILQQRSKGNFPKGFGAGLQSLAAVSGKSGAQMDCSFVSRPTA